MQYAVTITASDHILPFCVIFKGRMVGTNATRDVETYVKEPVYVCKVTVLMNQDVMLLLVVQVLQPYSPTAPSNVQLILYFDSYCCYMLSSFEVQHIPGECLSYCKPVDVDFNKPFNSRIRWMWYDLIVVEVEKCNITNICHHCNVFC